MSKGADQCQNPALRYGRHQGAVARRLSAVLLLSGLVGLMVACSSPQSSIEGQGQLPENLVRCPESRPQMCTMQYDPVCAWHADGRRSTQGSACSACGDLSVEAYSPGECPASE